jgi:hypothetical protein
VSGLLTIRILGQTCLDLLTIALNRGMIVSHRDGPDTWTGTNRLDFPQSAPVHQLSTLPRPELPPNRPAHTAQNASGYGADSLVGVRLWCGRSDSNRHSLQKQSLSLSRLPFRHARTSARPLVATDSGPVAGAAPPYPARVGVFKPPARLQFKDRRSKMCRNRRSGRISARSGTSAPAVPMCHG